MVFPNQVNSDRRLLGIPFASDPTASLNSLQYDSVNFNFKWVSVGTIPVGTASGDIIYWNGTAWTLLPKGTAGQILQTGTPPSWVTKLFMTAGVASGDIIYFDGTNWVILAKDTGKILQSGTPPSWVTKPLAMTAGVASGDIIYFDGTNWVILTKGNADEILKTGTPPSWIKNKQYSAYPLTDETSLPTTGVKYVSEAIPYNMTIDDVIASLTTAGTGATLFQFDILKEDAVNANTFTTIFSTRPTIDASEFTSTTAATPKVISVTTLEAGRRLQLKIQAIDSNSLGRGAKIALVTHPT